MSDKEYMTKEGLGRLEKQLADLQEQLEKHRKYKGEEAIHAGDTWHDNPVFYEAEAKERVLMREIAEVQVKIRNAEIIAAPQKAKSVTLGSKVEIRFSDGSTETYQILGEADSDPTNGILSFKSPLAQALMNKSVGAKATYKVGDFVEEVKLLSITS